MRQPAPTARAGGVGYKWTYFPLRRVRYKYCQYCGRREHDDVCAEIAETGHVKTFRNIVSTKHALLWRSMQALTRSRSQLGRECDMDYLSKTYNQPGSPPGLWREHGDGTVAVRLICFSSDTHRIEQGVDAARCSAYRAAGDKLWIDIQGRPGQHLLDTLERCFGLHPLALEDVVHTGQRAKLEDYDTHLFVVLRSSFRAMQQRLRIGQISLFLGKDFVISVHDGSEDLFAPVRQRLENGAGDRIRSSGCDYLFYALIDLVVDRGFPILETYADELEELERVIIRNPREHALIDRIHEARRELLFLRRALWSQREAVGDLLRHDHPLIERPTRVYLRDCHDHANHLLELAESYRDMSDAVLELLFGALNVQMNDVMRVLTMIATVFIPLSFVAGVYGMNFDRAVSSWNMPELGWRYGYPVVMLLLGLIGVGMLLYFKRKRWL